ncbi:MAG TPA: serine hydrolase [Paraburkholderia sp.]|jgi:CubicO group peptidase (beta-lactamase class C family)
MSAWLGDFDERMHKLIHDWNVPGIGVSIVKDQEVVLAKGYGFRDCGNELPFTPATVFPIASNTKLFTAVAAGLLVERGVLSFDQPIRDVVPSLLFHDPSLNATVTLRDMLGHRTGVPRYDMIWYKAGFSPKESFERIRFMKPVAPFRSRLIYNNMMYDAVGHVIELLSGKPWDQFIRDEILKPLGMTHTAFTIADMLEQPEFSVPFSERRDGKELRRLPYHDVHESAPAGSMASNLDDMARWLIALMNNGLVGGVQVVPERTLNATLAPGLPFPEVANAIFGPSPELNSIYGMGRQTSSYRGHRLTSHGGALPGFYSQVSYLTREKLGVAVFVIGDHCSMVSNVVGFDVYDRLLGLEPTHWGEDVLAFRAKNKNSMQEARKRVTPSAVPNTRPSHGLDEYVGCYEHPAYGKLDIQLENGQLKFGFRAMALRLDHYHYDRFDTEDDEAEGMWSVSFLTSPIGDIDRAVMWLDEDDVVFRRVPDQLETSVLEQLAGTYLTETGVKLPVRLRDKTLTMHFPGLPSEILVPLKGLQFRTRLRPRMVFEFVFEDGCVTALRHWNSNFEFVLKRAKGDESNDALASSDEFDE